MFILRLFALLFICVLLSTQIIYAGTLEDVRARGQIACGVSLGLPGFSEQDENGNWSGLDVDVCRAVAAAVFGDAKKVDFRKLSAKERFTVLQSGGVDLLSRNTTWTLLRDAGLELNFAGVTYYDGQGFMVLKEIGLESAKELDGAVICVNLGTTTELNLSNFIEANDLHMRVLPFENHAEVASAYERNECDAMTSDRSALAAYRSEFDDPSAHIILPDVISKEPLGPVVREDDNQWFDIVKWSVFALIQGEESGVSSTNVEDHLNSKDPTVQRLLGLSGTMGEQLGLSNDWAYQIIKQVGNYSEVYDRNIGPETPINLPRNLNALWKDGGLMYSMPFR